MPIFGWDMCSQDWDRGLSAAEIWAAAGQDIAFMIHKIGEGAGHIDPRFPDFWRATRGLPMLLGAYYVAQPGNQQAQADRFLALLDRQAPGWRDGAFVLRVDTDNSRHLGQPPALAEIRAFVARLVTGAPAHRPVVHAPRRLYGDRLRGLDSPLWASNYGPDLVTDHRSAYPGDGSLRWVGYSGQTPAILRYGSRTRIATQHTCDASAFRGTLDGLCALVYAERDSAERDSAERDRADESGGMRTAGDPTRWWPSGVPGIAA